MLGIDLGSGRILHELDFGLRIHQDQIDRFQWIDRYAMAGGVMQLTEAGVHGTESNRIETADAIAGYLQYKWKGKRFSVTPGLRYENVTMHRMDYGKSDPERLGDEMSERTNQVDVWIPGIGFDYQFSKYLSTFAGVHKGFAPPGSKEGTKPEKSINYELGVRYTKNSLSGEAVLFYNDYDNLLGADLAAAGGSGSTDLFNGGEVQTKGLEFKVSYDLLTSYEKSKYSLPFSVVYTYTDAAFQNDFESDFEGWGEVSAGDQFPYLAKHQFTFMAGLDHRKYNLNLSGRYMDEMRTVPGQDELLTSERTDAYFIVDANINYSIHRNVDLFASVSNLTDKVYLVARRPAGLRPGLPRSFSLGMKANF